MQTEGPLSFSIYIMTPAIWGVTLSHFGNNVIFFLQSANSTEKRKCRCLVRVYVLRKVGALKH